MADFLETDAAIATVGKAFLDRTLPRERWTHAAHFATSLWLIRTRPDIVVERDMPALIRSYNASLGGVNDDHHGYHETITQASLAMARRHLRDRPDDEPLCESVDALMASRLGDKNWPLDHWTHEILFSVEARRGWIAPDRTPLPD